MGLLFGRRKQKAAEREAREKAELARRIREQAKEQSEQWLKIVNDCVFLVNATIKPNVFFPRYALMLEYLKKLAGLECTGIFDNSKELPSEAFLRVEAQFPAATNEFINRSFEASKAHADTLKTEKGKANAIRRFFDDMENYIIHMDAESIEYLDTLKENYFNL